MTKAPLPSWTQTMLHFALIVLLSISIYSCGDDDDTGNTTDGDSELSETDTSSDGDTTTDGDTEPDGDGIDGDTNVDGDNTDGDVIDGDTPDGDTTVDGDTTDGDTNVDGDIPQLSCNRTGYAPEVERVDLLLDDQDETLWSYKGYSQARYPMNVLRFEMWKGNGAPTEPGTYPIGEDETSYATCANCMVFEYNCDYNDQGVRYCGRTYMPAQGGEIVISEISDVPGDMLSVTFNNVALQQVTIAQDMTTTPVENGDVWCLDTYTFSVMVKDPGYVHLDKPEVDCGYPEPPYYFLGPEPGKTEPEPGTVPPLSWPGAYHYDEITGLDLAQYRCDHPETKTLFILVSAGWCPACQEFLMNQFCIEGGLEDRLVDLNADFIHVVGESSFPGIPTGNSFANDKINLYGCTEGYRLSDIDSNADERVIFDSVMFNAIPWAAAIRMSDMKLTHEQSSEYYLDLIQIAVQNMDE